MRRGSGCASVKPGTGPALRIARIFFPKNDLLLRTVGSASSSASNASACAARLKKIWSAPKRDSRREARLLPVLEGVVGKNELLLRAPKMAKMFHALPIMTCCIQ